MQHSIPLAVLLCLAASTAAPAQPRRSSEAEARQEAEAALDRATDEIMGFMGFRWHAAQGGMSVQFGVPGTDDRALRVDCENGALLVMAPEPDTAPDERVTVTFWRAERREGTIAEMGDGPNFLVRLAPGDPLARRLATSRRILIQTPVRVTSVPTRGGGARLLRALRRRCAAQAR
jgi:hypothetical protein